MCGPACYSQINRIQGVLPRDAIEALLACKGKYQAARAMASEWQPKGGAARLTLERASKHEQWLNILAGLAEARTVLQRFTESGLR